MTNDNARPTITDLARFIERHGWVSSIALDLPQNRLAALVATGNTGAVQLDHLQHTRGRLQRTLTIETDGSHAFYCSIRVFKVPAGIDVHNGLLPGYLSLRLDVREDFVTLPVGEPGYAITDLPDELANLPDELIALSHVSHSWRRRVA